ncbi:CHAT domain-containing protein [Sulfitobacter pontiacus]|uniref:CHAT domain-containing protein n=1 Tax=Sulfitobacter pontiacus TaxID=60137 RepID=UPI0030ECCE47
MNSIALFGRQENTAQSVEFAVKKHEANPEIVAAAVSALAALYRGQIPNLASLKNIPPETQLLAAMQNVPASLLELGGLAIDLSQADTEILKLALIVVGLNKDIKNLFHPQHNNGDIVRELGQHDDKIVRQYSVWAVIENDLLTVDHLGIQFDALENEPENVQSKLLQLGASSLADLAERQSLIIRGSNLPSIDAREGLSKGLAKTYYEGLQDATLSWFETEDSKRVQLVLAEHFARFSNESPSYLEKALELDEIGGEYRERVLLGAEGLPLYGQIMSRKSQPSLGFFDSQEDEEMKRVIRNTRSQSVMNVLVLNATPDDQGRIRADKEAALLEEQLEMVKNPKRNLNIVQKFAVRLDMIQKELLNNEPRILHFSGHGDVGVLLFEDRQGRTSEIDGTLLAEMLAAYGNLECVVLHACYAEEVARACRKHVNIVVGSTDTIDDRTAPKFTYAFYQGLAHGRPYQNAFAMGIAEVATVSRIDAAKYKLLD